MLVCVFLCLCSIIYTILLATIGAQVYTEVVPALLGLARALQKSFACRRDAFRHLVESSRGGVAGRQPHQAEEEKCDSSGQELDLDADSINMLLTMVGERGTTCTFFCTCTYICMPLDSLCTCNKSLSAPQDKARAQNCNVVARLHPTMLIHCITLH